MRSLIHKILKEETEIDRSILNFLTRRVKVETKNLWTADYPLFVKEITFKVGDNIYGFNSFNSKKEQLNKILEMLSENDIIELGEYNSNTLNTDRQRVIKTIRHFLNNLL